MEREQEFLPLDREGRKQAYEELQGCLEVIQAHAKPPSKYQTGNYNSLHSTLSVARSLVRRLLQDVSDE